MSGHSWRVSQVSLTLYNLLSPHMLVLMQHFLYSGIVMIDVRNANESAIGRFQPPSGGATLLDPRMRRSTEFPEYLIFTNSLP